MAPEREGAFDEKLVEGTPPEEVAQRVDSMLTRQSRMHAVARDGGDDRAIAGQLTQISLLDLVQLLHLNRRTGMVELVQRETGGRERSGRVYLRDGDLVQAQVGPVEGEKALYRLLAWREGSFSFAPGPVQAPAQITASTRALLMEGTRHLDEWDRARSTLPSLDASVELKVASAELPNVVQPLTQEVLLLLEIYSRVGDVVDHCSYPDYQVLRTLQTLIERGLVEVSAASAEKRPAPGPGLLGSAQKRRLKHWLQAPGSRGAAYPQAKLVIACAGPGIAREFLRLLAELPEVHLEGVRGDTRGRVRPRRAHRARRRARPGGVAPAGRPGVRASLASGGSRSPGERRSGGGGAARTPRTR